MENLNHHKVKRLTVSPMDARITRRLYKRWRRNSLNQVAMLQTALVVRCMGVCLSLQGTQVPSLVQEDSTACIATEPVPQGCRALTLGPKRCNA